MKKKNLTVGYIPQTSSNLMKTMFKKGESGGLINKYMTICTIQATDMINLQVE